jgi:type I restriction enzyme M protein
VDTFEEEAQIDIVALSREMVDINAQIKQKEADFLCLLDELAITDETKELIEATKRIFM